MIMFIDVCVDESTVVSTKSVNSIFRSIFAIWRLKPVSLYGRTLQHSTTISAAAIEKTAAQFLAVSGDLQPETDPCLKPKLMCISMTQ